MKKIILLSIFLCLNLFAQDYYYTSDNPLKTPIKILGTNLKLWVEGDNTSLIKDGSNNVSVWYDKSMGKALTSNLVSNSTFDNSDNLVLGDGWTVSDGKLNANVAGGYSTGRTRVPTMVYGKVYKITFDITVTIGQVEVTIGSNPISLGFISQSGSYTAIGISTSGGYADYIAFNAYGTGGAFQGTIDNVICQEITGNHLIQSTATNQPLAVAYNTNYSAVQSDGTNDFLKTLTFPLNTNFTVWVVYRSDIASRTVFDGFTAGTINYTDADTGVYKVVKQDYTSNAGGITLFANATPNNYFKGKVLFLCVKQGTASFNEDYQIKKYIKAKFGVSVPEVADIPPVEVPLMGWTDVGYHYGTMKALKDTLLSAGANTYYFHILESSDWDSLLVFLPLAQSNNINTWVYLTDRSRMISNDVQPYVSDYQSWADTIAKLSNVYSTIKGYTVDDFWGGLGNVVTNGYLDTMIIRGKEINPDLLFYAGSYMGELDRIYTEGDFSTVMDGQIAYYPQDSLQILSAIQKNIPHSRAGISLPANTNTSIGQYGRVTQTANITNPDSITLTFHYADSYNGALTNYHTFQVAVDSLEGNNTIPSASSDFATDGTAYYPAVNCTKSYNAGEQAMNWAYTSGSVWGFSKNNTVTIGVKYRVKFRAKSSNCTRKFFPTGFGATYTKIKNPNLATTYQDYEGTVTPSASTIIIYVEGGAAGEVVTLDDIIITEAAGSSLSEVWTADATGIDDSTVTVNLKPFVTGRSSFKVGLGIYEKTGVGNLAISGFVSMVSGYGITIDTNLTTWTDTVSGSFTVTQAPSQGKTLPLVMLLPGDEADWVLFYSDTSSTFESRLRTVLNFHPTIEGSTTWWLKYTEPNFYDALKKVYLSYK